MTTTPHDKALEKCAAVIEPDAFSPDAEALLDRYAGKPHDRDAAHRAELKYGMGIGLARQKAREKAGGAISAYLTSIGGIVCSREPSAYMWRHHAYEDRPYRRPLAEKDVSAGFTAVPLHTPIEAGNGGDGWLPIETAPRDGTKVLCFSPGNKTAIYAETRRPHFTVDEYRSEGRSGFYKMWPEAPYTHWRQLPSPPSPSNEGREKA